MTPITIKYQHARSNESGDFYSSSNSSNTNQTAYFMTTSLTPVPTLQSFGSTSTGYDIKKRASELSSHVKRRSSATKLQRQLKPIYSNVKFNVIPLRYHYQHTDIPYNNRHYSKTDRQINIPFPICRFLKMRQIFDEKNLPRMEVLEEHFRNEGRLELEAAIRILTDVKEILAAEATLLRLKKPVTIVGDIHGQFYDMLSLFKVGGQLERTKYLFLGDYVDRGHFGIEVILYLFSLKLNYPMSVFLLRGNHECRYLTNLYTFKRECQVKYNLKFYNHVMETFDNLPLAALIDSTVLCMHGGLSPNIHRLKDIDKIYRFCEPPFAGAMCDLLWADPLPDFNENDTKLQFRPNTVRQISNYFTYEAVLEFQQRNQIQSIIRAHEFVSDGFKIHKKAEDTIYPSLITLFSAPNYQDLYNNKAAIIHIDQKGFHIKQFAAVQHPYWLPNFENGFNLTLPYIAEQVTNILVSVLKSCIEGVTIPRAREIQTDAQLKRKVRVFARVALCFEKYRRKMMTKSRLTAGTDNIVMKQNLIRITPVPPFDGTYRSIEKFLISTYPHTCFEEDGNEF